MAIIIGLLIYSIRPKKVEHENETLWIGFQIRM
jgi:hypothetical protein